MNRYPWLDGYLMDRPGAEQDYKLEWQWQRYLVRGRMFAAVCTPGAEHKLHAGRTMIILKCDPVWPRPSGRSTPMWCPAFTPTRRPGTPSIWTDRSLTRSCGTCATCPTRW